jgi:MFS transporter, PAT family, beta-lactamase induction signal transducer AmpG
MNSSVATSATPANKLQTIHRALVVLILGFASGIPLALTGGAMQAWLTVEGIDLATIGFLGLVALPYTFKFLWAPLMDRFEPPFLGRRRGWIVIMQLVVALGLFLMSRSSPTLGIQAFGAFALFIAFSSASLDIVIDAYRTDLLPVNERGLGASFSVLGYRVAMVISGGITLIWAQQWKSWPSVYAVMSIVMAATAVISLIILPKVSSEFKPLASEPSKELLGFVALLLGVMGGYFLGQEVLSWLGFQSNSENKWVRLLFVLTQLAFAMMLAMLFIAKNKQAWQVWLIAPIAALAGYFLAPGLLTVFMDKPETFDGLRLLIVQLVSVCLFVWMAVRHTEFATLSASLDSFFVSKEAWMFLVMIVLYKLGDAFAMSLTTPFMIRGLGFEQTEVGLANKTIGLLTTIFGAMLGGLIMLRVRLSKALIAFGVLQLISNLGYYWLAVQGKDAWGTFNIPAFNILIAKLPEATPMDGLMLTVIGIDNLSGGMGTAALVALLMSLCNKKFSATHFALLSAFASLGRVFIGPFSGVLADQVGWPIFFLTSLIVAAPGVVLIGLLRGKIDQIAPLNNK